MGRALNFSSLECCSSSLRCGTGQQYTDTSALHLSGDVSETRIVFSVSAQAPGCPRLALICHHPPPTDIPTTSKLSLSHRRTEANGKRGLLGLAKTENGFEVTALENQSSINRTASKDQDLFDEVRAQMNEPEFGDRASERMWKSEGLFAEAKVNHCLARPSIEDEQKSRFRLSFYSGASMHHELGERDVWHQVRSGAQGR